MPVSIGAQDSTTFSLQNLAALWKQLVGSEEGCCIFAFHSGRYRIGSYLLLLRYDLSRLLHFCSAVCLRASKVWIIQIQTVVSILITSYFETCISTGLSLRSRSFEFDRKPLV